MLLLRYLIDELAREGRPSLEDAASAQSSEETRLLPPNHVLMLVFHPDTVYSIEVRYRDHHDRVVIFNVGQPLAVEVILDQIAEARRGLRDPVHLDSPAEQGLHIEDEVALLVLKLQRLRLVALQLVRHLDLLVLPGTIDAGIDEALVDVESRADIHVLERQSALLVLIVDGDLVGAHLDVAVHVIIELDLGGVELLEDLFIILLALIQGVLVLIIFHQLLLRLQEFSRDFLCRRANDKLDAHELFALLLLAHLVDWEVLGLAVV